MLLDLANILSKTELSRKDKILVLIDHNKSAKQINEIKLLAHSNGLREVEKWNISMILGGLKGMVIKIKDGWVLTNKGIEYLKTKKLTNHSPTAKQHLDLDKLARKIKSPYVQDFVIEAVSCIENNLLKSAVVFSWVGAISVLYEYVEANKLKQFNLEAKKRDNRWKDAINIEGLSKMKEYDFLQIIEGIGVVGKNTKNELENCLKLRNGCGHPSTLKIGENTVAAHVEILILNVFQKFC